MGVRGAGARRRALPGAIGSLAAVAAALLVLAGGAAPADAAGKPLTRYSIVHGCFAMKPAAGGDLVAQTGAGYTASAKGFSAAEPFRMQATELGVYLLYGPAQDFMGLANGGAVIVATEPSQLTEWTVTGGGRSFRIANEFTGRELAVSDSDEVVSVPAGGGEAFKLLRTRGCADYPEVELNVRGKPSRGSPYYGETRGLVDGHMHGMAFEFLGGKAHCGQPWHKYGAPYALVDCEDHQIGGGCAAILENVLYGNPARCHDHVGWPTFNDWPHPQSLTHESMYYRWLERAWRGGLRIFVNLYVENRVLCDIYPFKKPGYNCNEMDTVLRQADRMRELQDYIDAQSGGPGKGWFRIVRNPFQARRVINKGKLAVIQGMEVSEPFNCRLVPIDQPSPACTPENINEWLDRLHALGVRQLEITNKFDNALTGVAGDGGTFGIAVNAGQFLDVSTSFWDLGPCEDPHYHDNSPGTAVIPDQDQIFGAGLQALLGVLPPLPIYGDPPNCNQKGFSDLGEHAVREIVERKMIFDPDHMSVLARNQALDLVEKLDYPGVFSSHSWSTEDALPRIYKLGGIVTPYAGDSEGFVHKWQHLRSVRKKLGRQYFGVGYGADANGFGSQGGPRTSTPQSPPLAYPFKSFDGKVTLDRQVSGERVFDLNSDGVAHYGLYPDWIADLRVLAGRRIVRDMARGAEAYLQMWERAYGVPEVRCGGWKPALTATGIRTRIGLGQGWKSALRSAGQPVKRKRVWRWCAGGGDEVVAGFARGRVEFVLSDLRRHLVGGLGGADEVAPGVFADGANVYLARGDRVTHAGVASSALRADPARLAAKLRRAAR